MTQNASQIFLFPHTSLSGRDFRHLALLVPGFSMLQVVRPPSAPEWAGVSSSPVIEDESQIRRIELYLEGYREFARTHGEGSLLAGLNRLWPDAELESRFGIQHDLKGKPAMELDAEERQILEAAVFLEMARDLDEKETELESDFSEASELEEEFREILGITEDQEVEAPIEPLSPPLTPDRTHLSFMLPKRIAFWFRLFFRKPPEVRPILLALIPEAMDVLIDPFRTRAYPTGTPLDPCQMDLGGIPSLEELPGEEFSALLRRLDTDGMRESWWKSLGALLENLENDQLLKDAEARLGALAQSVEGFLKEAGRRSTETAALNLVCTDRWSGGELWKSVDRSGYEALSGESPAAAAHPLLLFMS